MGVLDRAIAHFDARAQQSVAVPEWAEKPGQDFLVYFKSPNPATLSRVQTESKGDAVQMMARLVCHCATDESGKKLFAPLDHKEMMLRVDPAVLTRVANAIMAEARLDPEGAEKNSAATPSG